MIKKYDCVATIGQYIDPATGRKVKRTLCCGAVFESTSGKLVLRIDATPAAAAWSGWMALHPSMPAGMRQTAGMPPAPPPQDEPEDEDIPF